MHQLPPPPTALLPNPGGVLPPEQVIGRDALIRECWQTLAQRSLALLAPRRMGKTSICRRMAHWPESGFITRYRDLEGLSRATDLVRQLFEDVADLLRPTNKVARRARTMLERLTGTVEVKSFKLNLIEQDWRQLLEAIFEDLQQHCTEQDIRVVLFWDEFLLFIRELDRAGHTDEATTLLDLLRAIRQRHTHIRMVLTGSIGLQEVIASLKRRGYGNDPINDVARILVQPLEPADAILLTTALAYGLGQAGDVSETIAHIASLCEGHPYLIQHVLHRLHTRQVFSAEAAAEELDRLLDEPTDPLDLRHYVVRLRQNHPPPMLTAANAVLDRVAVSEGGLTTQELLAALPVQDPEVIREALHALRRDLYLQRTGWRYRFRFGFLARYWRRERGL